MLKCLAWLHTVERGRHLQGQHRKLTGMIDMLEAKEHMQPAPAWLSFRSRSLQVVQMASSTSVCICTCAHTHVYIFIYLYKHYICIHTIYVIYNICIMHINSNKCICVIFKIEQLYLEMVNAENWLYCWSVDLMNFLGERMF